MTPNYGEGSSSTFATVSKVWKDNNNIQKLRPSFCTLKLFQNENLYKTLTLTPSNAIVNDPNTWELTIDNLPEYDNLGNKYFYSVEEDPIKLSNGDKYIPSISKNIVTNTLSGKTSIIIKKIWRDWNNELKTRPTSLDVDILNNKDQVVKTVTLTAANATPNDKNIWIITIDNLDKYDENGALYKYHIREHYTEKMQANYLEPEYDKTGLIVSNKGYFIPDNPWTPNDPITPQDKYPDYQITVHKNILNSSNKPATAADFDKIKLDANGTYKFPIILRAYEINYKTDSNGHVYEEYGKPLDKYYKGTLTNKGDLVFNNIDAGKYEIIEGDCQYFDFINFEKLSSSSNAILTKENGKYFITLPGLTAQDEKITINVNNRINSKRSYDETTIENNLFKK